MDVVLSPGLISSRTILSSIYLIDPGFYYFSSNSIESVRKINMKRINEFLKSSEVKLVRKR